MTILIAVGTAFRSLRSEVRLFREHVDKRIDVQEDRIGAQGEQLRERIDAQSEQLRDRIDAQGKETGEQLGQLRERMAKLEGLREAITGKRAA